jgi:phage terminase large subunit-like protein
LSNALELLAALVLEGGSRWGEAAEPWQWDDASAVLDVDGRRRHFLTRPRGGSKTTDLGGIAVAALLEQLPRLSESPAYAADRDQAAKLLKAIAGFLDRTPEIRGALKVDAYRVTNLRTGASVAIEASDDASAWGGKPPLTIVDEFAQWKTTQGPRRLWEAIFSALVKDPLSRLAIITSAGDPAHWSHKVLVKAKASDRWRVREVPGPVPWLDDDDLTEQRDMLTASQYAQLHMNQWTESEDRLTTVDDLRACVTLDGALAPQAGVRYATGVDLGLKDDRTVAAVCHLDGSRVVLDRMQVWAGTSRKPVRIEDVKAWLLEAHRAFRADVVLDPWQAVHLAQGLREERVSVHEFAFSSQSVGRLAVTLYRLLRDRALALPDDPELLDELANVRLREISPGVMRMDHDADKHDDRAIALALAAHHLVNRPAGSWRPMFTPDDEPGLRGRGLKLREDGRIEPLPAEEAAEERAKAKAEEARQLDDPMSSPERWHVL